MTERDAFEIRFEAAVRGYVGRVSSDLDPAELAHRIAVAEPRRHGLAAVLTGRRVADPLRTVWVLLLLAALLALVAGAAIVGSRLLERTPPLVSPLRLGLPDDVVGHWPSIAVGRDGDPLIAYLDEQADFGNGGDLGLYACSEPSCAGGTARTLDAGVMSDSARVAIGRDGNPIIAYYGVTDLKLYVCATPDCSEGTARTLDRYGDPRGFDFWSRALALAIGTDGSPIISYLSHSGATRDAPTTLRLYVCSTPDCSAGTVTTLDSVVGERPSIAIGRDGNPIISYGDAKGDLKLYVCSTPTCAAGALRTLDWHLASGSALVVGSDGNPLVAYLDLNRDLKLYACADRDCTAGSARVLDPLRYQGQSSSMALLPDGRPVISYVGEEVRLYVCATPSCADGSPRTLAATSVSSSSSLAVGADGDVVVAFYEALGGELKVVVVPAGDLDPGR